MKIDNKYTKMQESAYSAGTSNHLEHNANPDYWDILLVPDASFKNKYALDFGCGKGRNVQNIIDKLDFKRVDGVDISLNNINHCKKHLKDSRFFKNNGIDLKDISSDYYQFVMSTIVLQHIPVRDIRLNIKREIYRILKHSGIFRFQMGYGKDLINKNGTDRVAYSENKYDAHGTNGSLDVRIIDKTELFKDLEDIGFIIESYGIKDSFSDLGHPQWIYVSCKKPNK